MAEQTIVVSVDRVSDARSIRFDNVGEPIYAVMVTGKDPYHARLAGNAILSFLTQSYGNRILIIVNDGDYRFDVRDVPQDRVVEIRLAARGPLGALRNVALDSMPRDALWIQWDDDDWHHPSAMADQHRVLTEANVNTCFMRYQIKYAFEPNTAWTDYFPGGFAGTLMSRNRPDLRYPHLPRGEDSAYCLNIKHRYRWTAWDNPPHYYLRFIHGHNTWPDAHFRLSERRAGQWLLSPEGAGYLKSVLPLYRGPFYDKPVIPAT